MAKRLITTQPGWMERLVPLSKSIRNGRRSCATRPKRSNAPKSQFVFLFLLRYLQTYHTPQILNRHSSFITSQLERLAQSTDAIHARDQAESGLLETLTTDLHETIASITMMFGRWENELKGSCEALTKDIGLACITGVEQARSRALHAGDWG